jgi:hypothetical protein
MPTSHTKKFSPIFLVSLPPPPPHVPRSEIAAPLRANTSYLSLVSYCFTLVCVKANGTDQLSCTPVGSLCSERAKGNRQTVMQFTPVSYINPRFQQANCSSCCLLHAVVLLGVFSDLKMEETCSSDMLADFQWTTQQMTDLFLIKLEFTERQCSIVHSLSHRFPLPLSFKWPGLDDVTDCNYAHACLLLSP